MNLNCVNEKEVYNGEPNYGVCKKLKIIYVTIPIMNLNKMEPGKTNLIPTNYLKNRDIKLQYQKEYNRYKFEIYTEKSQPGMLLWRY